MSSKICFQGHKNIYIYIRDTYTVTSDFTSGPDTPKTEGVSMSLWECSGVEQTGVFIYFVELKIYNNFICEDLPVVKTCVHLADALF